MCVCVLNIYCYYIVCPSGTSPIASSQIPHIPLPSPAFPAQRPQKSFRSESGNDVNRYLHINIIIIITIIYIEICPRVCIGFQAFHTFVVYKRIKSVVSFHQNAINMYKKWIDALVPNTFV